MSAQDGRPLFKFSTRLARQLRAEFGVKESRQRHGARLHGTPASWKNRERVARRRRSS